MFALLCLLLCVPYLYRLFFPPNYPQISIRQLAVFDSVINHTETATGRKLFPFDPNTANDETLLTLGFTPNNVKTLRRYFAAGGRIKSAESLKKIYGIRPVLAEALQPYVQIDGVGTKRQLTERADSPAKNQPHSLAAILELNTADSIQLVRLYRIGPALAHRILDYRTRLGGFVSLEQLLEIWGFDEDILYDLQGKISVNPALATRINLNTIELDQLKTHPYFKFKLSQAIVNYRLQHGKFGSVNELKNIRIVNDSILGLVKRYAVVE